MNDDGWSKIGENAPTMDSALPATDAAKQWSGWGTALKPAWEPIIVARKPLQGTVAENVLRHGTGGINVDGCRVGLTQYDLEEYIPNRVGYKDGIDHMQKNTATTGFIGKITAGTEHQVIKPAGRWPANLIHDGSDEVVGRLNEAARFFYCAKASKADRDEGCEGFAGNHHPTVKPTALMRYLCRLVTPPGGVVFDPFMGSGSTGKAATLEGFRFIGIEIDPEYAKIARARIAAAQPDMPLLVHA